MGKHIETCEAEGAAPGESEGHDQPEGAELVEPITIREMTR